MTENKSHGSGREEQPDRLTEAAEGRKGIVVMPVDSARPINIVQDAPGAPVIPQSVGPAESAQGQAGSDSGG